MLNMAEQRNLLRLQHQIQRGRRRSSGHNIWLTVFRSVCYTNMWPENQRVLCVCFTDAARQRHSSGLVNSTFRVRWYWLQYMEWQIQTISDHKQLSFVFTIKNMIGQNYMWMKNDTALVSGQHLPWGNVDNKSQNLIKTSYTIHLKPLHHSCHSKPNQNYPEIPPLISQ